MTSPVKAETKSREVKNAKERRSRQHLRGSIDNANRHSQSRAKLSLRSSHGKKMKGLDSPSHKGEARRPTTTATHIHTGRSRDNN
ncbi:hypothetical protein YC2023_088964 [Brassica napus]